MAGVADSSNKEERLSARTRARVDLKIWLPGELGVND